MPASGLAHGPTPEPSPVPAVELAEKVDFLRRPGSYPGRTAEVEVIETHMAWVFLAGERAYKLKKPVRYSFLDFSTLEARRADCREEVRLNRRLAPDVYLGVLPLLVVSGGGLRLAEEGQALRSSPEGVEEQEVPAGVVEWLVVMRRLPRDGMLDARLSRGWVHAGALSPATRLLGDFYSRLPPVSLDPPRYPACLLDDVLQTRRELGRFGARVPARRVEDVAAALEASIERNRALLEERVRRGIMVEGHGDLRPEHVFLGPPPAVIDCLEFNRTLRTLDPVDDLAYLALECERQGAPNVGGTFLEVYSRVTGDKPPSRLVELYTSGRAFLRAKIAIWHLEDHEQDPERWTRRCHEYLDLAAAHLKNLGEG